MESRIREAGWQQGSLLTDVGDAFLFVPEQPISDEANLASQGIDTSDREIDAAVRDPAENQLSILISHTCDIIKPPQSYPRLEVLRCYIEEDKGKLKAAATNSARYFLVDSGVGLVADFASRTSIEKAVLLSREPREWPSSPAMLKRFRQWLGSRYTRSIDPDEVVEVLNKPIAQQVKKISKQRDSTLTRALHLIKRINVLRKNDYKPYDITLLLFVDEQDLDEAYETLPALAMDFQENLSPEHVNLSHVIVTEERISLSDYLATTYLELDFYTYEGEEVTGAEPIEGL